MLNRECPVVLHGDGTPKRRYLYAGDAADAFDTILHKGQLGEIYNVGSYDEISNIELCGKLLTSMKIPQETPEQVRKWVKYTHDRPFNDRRYAVDATKLRNLGWDQKTTFEEGLKLTVDWYTRFGETWWGDISHVLTPFPVVTEGEVMPDDAHSMRSEPIHSEEANDEIVEKSEHMANHDANATKNSQRRGDGSVRVKGDFTRYSNDRVNGCASNNENKHPCEEVTELRDDRSCHGYQEVIV